ncbi:hypothetical protein JR316_0009221 [Psilocybe cubensis]|uniref:T6SS Phospholipase effector Tle1-like catalytic domain-containing protein n=2 Tax=Psilocybe cubensis TaxID=181762 RepID=A0A8H7XWZ6_PSICU|nr:hypothetical protein JR316_0009221 [Psilocybe cubensis]KAH9478760.1 hypothetical protein JR316_0009221 [Psilocybe cubensis]
MSNDETTPLLNKMKSDSADNLRGNIRTYPPASEDGHRTLVLLFDGTGDTDNDNDISNVIALKNMLHPLEDHKKQLVYYQTGIGTYDAYIPCLTIKIPFIGELSRLLDSAIAWSLSYHVVGGVNFRGLVYLRTADGILGVEAYQWLIDHYQENDKVCLFGFSRGAYTARAVSAMINKVGLLPRALKDKAKDAYNSFARQGCGKWKDSEAFRKENACRDVIMEFVGVWDTVNSVGIISARKLPYTASNSSVRTFRHAVSLDEHRARFRSNMWNPPSTDPKKQPWPLVTDVDQVWFAGAHCDVGGGSVPNGTRPNLAHIPLRWMVRECFKAKTGITFDPAEISAIGINPDALYPEVLERPAALEPTPDLKPSTVTVKKPGVAQHAGSWLKSWFSTPRAPETQDYRVYTEEQLDLMDALAPIYDQLIIHKMKWWLLEHIWLKGYSPQEKRDVWRRNLGRGRTILPPVDADLTDPVKAKAKHQVPLDPRWAKLRVHRTVRTRMACVGDDKHPPYIPKALMNGETTLDKLEPALIQWVD